MDILAYPHVINIIATIIRIIATRDLLLLTSEKYLKYNTEEYGFSEKYFSFCHVTPRLLASNYSGSNVLSPMGECVASNRIVLSSYYSTYSVPVILQPDYA